MKRLLHLVILLALLWPGVCLAAIARVGTPVSNQVNGGTACTLTYSPTEGNFLAVSFLRDGGTTVTSVADNGAAGGSTYVQALNDAYSGNANYISSVYYTTSAAASVTTITVTVSGTTGVGCIVSEYSGVATSSALDVVSTEASGTGTTQTSNSVSPQSGDLQIGFFFNFTNSTSTFTATGPFSLVANQTVNYMGVVFGVTDQINSNTSTAGATTGGSIAWSAYLVNFKAASSTTCRGALLLTGVGGC